MLEGEEQDTGTLEPDEEDTGTLEPDEEELSNDDEDYEADEDYRSNNVAVPEARALDFGNEPALPPLETVEITYTTEPIVHDYQEMDDFSMLELITGGEQLIFKMKDVYNCTPREQLLKYMEDKSNVFYECKREMHGAPFIADIFSETPYYRLRLGGNFMLPMLDLVRALDSHFSVFELVKVEKKIDFIVSFSSVQVTPGLDGFGRRIDIVSADHCQDGSNQEVYTLKAVKFIHAKSPSEAGRRRRKTFRKGKGKKKAKKHTRKQTRKRRV
jgi:hypothetical protein